MVGRTLMEWSGALQTVAERVTALVERRLYEPTKPDSPQVTHTWAFTPSDEPKLSTIMTLIA